jgi:hypothetical protein
VVAIDIGPRKVVAQRRRFLKRASNSSTVMRGDGGEGDFAATVTWTGVLLGRLSGTSGRMAPSRYVASNSMLIKAF